MAAGGRGEACSWILVRHEGAGGARLRYVTAHELLRAALKLPPEARAALAAELIESLDGAEPPEEIEAAWALEIRRRCAELDSGAVTPVPWEEARRRILAAATRGAAS